MKTTFMANAGNITRKWYIVDAAGLTVGRLAASVAKVLTGKNKPTYTPHVDTGDNVIIVNASKLKLTGKKATDKIYYHHSEYRGGLKSVSAGELLAKNPVKLVELSVKGMLPKGPLGRQMIKKLHVYAGAEHNHAAQQPKALEIKY